MRAKSLAASGEAIAEKKRQKQTRWSVERRGCSQFSLLAWTGAVPQFSASSVAPLLPFPPPRATSPAAPERFLPGAGRRFTWETRREPFISTLSAWGEGRPEPSGADGRWRPRARRRRWSSHRRGSSRRSARSSCSSRSSPSDASTTSARCVCMRCDRCSVFLDSLNHSVRYAVVRGADLGDRPRSCLAPADAQEEEPEAARRGSAQDQRRCPPSLLLVFFFAPTLIAGGLHAQMV